MPDYRRSLVQWMQGVCAMSCLDDAKLIQLLGSGPADASLGDARAHLEGCAVCRERLAAFARVDQMLGAWETPQRRANLTEAVLQQTEQVRGTGRWGWMRIAASVLVFGMLGWALGQATHKPPEPMSAQEDLVMAMGLDLLSERVDLLGTLAWWPMEELP
jgi:hypothetical protein